MNVRVPLLSVLAALPGCYLFKSAAIEETCEDLPEGCSGQDTPPPVDSADTGTTDTPEDADGDGFFAGVDDCDDSDPAVNPAATETCATPGVDDDCDGLVDSEDTDVEGVSEFWADLDSDGWGDPDDTVWACVQPDRRTDRPGDCDDTEATVNPGQREVCDNGVDDDCDGEPGVCATEGTVPRSDADAAFVTTSGDYLGYSTLGVGDVTGDGQLDVVVGTPDTTDTGRGRVEVHSGAPSGTVPLGAGWADTVWVGDSDYQSVGRLVQVIPDVTGDGLADVAIHSSDEELFIAGGARSGSVREAHLLLGLDSNNYDGHPVAAGDLNGDGQADLLVGAPYHNDGELHLLAGPVSSGRASIATAALATITPTSSYAAFGYVVLSGDLNGDGIDDYVATAPQEDDGAGAIHIFEGGSGAVSTDDAVTTIRGRAEDGLGFGAVLGDLDQDGSVDLIASAAYRLFDGSSATGAVLWFDQPGTATDADDAVFTVESIGDYGFLGYGLAVGDTDGDGRPGLVASAPYPIFSGVEVSALVGFHDVGAGTVSAADADFIVPESTTYGFGFDLQMADLDRSGTDDLVVSSPLDGRVDVFYLSGL